MCRVITLASTSPVASVRDELFPESDCADGDEECVAEKSNLMASIKEESLDLDDMRLYDTTTCPHGNVIGIMRTTSERVLTTSPSTTLEDIIPLLNEVTGLPVLGPEGRVMGVISRKDIIKVRKGSRKGTMKDTVAQHMTVPAITVSKNSSVQQAADLMLQLKIRRLPVVDEDGFCIGIVSRSDIFRPLFMEAYNLFMEKEKAALSGPLKSSGAAAVMISSIVLEPPSVEKKSIVRTPVSWKVKYLYDGDCPMCLSLMTVLKRQDNGRNLVKFVNIADPDYKPKSHMGITYEEAMETIHAIQPDGTVLYGSDALRELFDTVGLGWATRISELPIIKKLVDMLYDFLSANRISLGGALDGIIAAKRMEMSKEGKETCSDIDEQCTTEW
ncbi:hypothetical protein CEUSTIGMA_g11105.t1 [Chlamydomonas eustigma]|uniref:CBS domain-containing protein n=1 Tax=Chlamydomonas eustigma TaxID=1157962 RepID=A0A250XLL9_9CHLO|nr:hypothetical protein CEUSTIGMA_g11105.t1 [Chlamydomonas eustigma]|eukprot:GAX83680.1 hypothetical protein CEUSTIGMA_g11105.t1 [Chlamydomonas eustigma]